LLLNEVSRVDDSIWTWKSAETSGRASEAVIDYQILSIMLYAKNRKSSGTGWT